MAVCARPLDFQVKLRIQRTIFIHAFVAAVLSRGMPLANTGALLSLLDGLAGGDRGIPCCLVHVRDHVSPNFEDDCSCVFLLIP